MRYDNDILLTISESINTEFKNMLGDSMWNIINTNLKMYAYVSLLDITTQPDKIFNTLGRIFGEKIVQILEKQAITIACNTIREAPPQENIRFRELIEWLRTGIKVM